MQNNINCLKCKYYFITWDSRFPRGCTFFNFKDTRMPSLVVYEASGKACLNFSSKDESSNYSL